MMDNSGNAKTTKGPNVTYAKEIITVGIWGNRPREGTKCNVEISCITAENITLNEIQEAKMSVCLSSEYTGEITIGNSDTDIDRSLEKCVQNMLKMEVSVVTLTFSPFTNNITSAETNMKPRVMCKVHLKDINNKPHIFEWSDDNKYEWAMYHKMRGVELYKCGRTRDAFFRFSRALKSLIIVTNIYEEGAITELNDNIKSLRVTLCNNIASCHLQLKNYSYTIEMCNKVLALDNNNIKAHFRRGVAYMEIQKFDEAKEDFDQVQQIDPQNAAVREKQQMLRLRQKEYDAKLASVIRKMFV